MKNTKAVKKAKERAKLQLDSLLTDALKDRLKASAKATWDVIGGEILKMMPRQTAKQEEVIEAVLDADQLLLHMLFHGGLAKIEFLELEKILLSVSYEEKMRYFKENIFTFRTYGMGGDAFL